MRRVRAIALTGARRLAALPDLVTIAESGYPGFQSGIWYGVIAPARTPPEVIARLNGDLVKIVRSADVTASLNAEGADIEASTPEVFAEHIRAETARWAKVIKEAKIAVN